MGLTWGSEGNPFSTALYYGQVLARALGWGLSPFCVLGIAVFAAKMCRARTDILPAGSLALICSVWAYHSFLNVRDSRYALAALPPALLLTVRGFTWAC